MKKLILTEKNNKICKECNCAFVDKYLQNGGRKFCSGKCYYAFLSKNGVWNKNKKMSEQYRNKCRIMNIGRLCSEETKQKMSLKHKSIGTGKWMLGRKLSQETCDKLRANNPRYWKNKKLPYDVWNKGKHHAPILGDKHWNWQGGLTSKNEKVRKSLEYKIWRKAVYERDNYTCVVCNERGGELQADHIKPFSLFPELRLAIDNGRTICKNCHKKTDTYGHKVHRFKNLTDAEIQGLVK